MMYKPGVEQLGRGPLSTKVLSLVHIKRSDSNVTEPRGGGGEQWVGSQSQGRLPPVGCSGHGENMGFLLRVTGKPPETFKQGVL